MTGNASVGAYDAKYFGAYKAILIAAGFIGITLPVGLILGDLVVLDAGFSIRGSLSSYYYSPLRDLFVGALCVIGVLLVTYDWPSIRILRSPGGWSDIVDFWVSFVAGAALLVVAFCPTEPPGVSKYNDCKYADPTPAPCTAVQHRFGDSTLYHLHIASAIVALCLLLVLAIRFARQERRPRLVWVHRLSASAIALGLVLALVGIVVNDSYLLLGRFSWLYTGEVLALLGFGFGWILRGFFLLKEDGRTAGTAPGV